MPVEQDTKEWNRKRRALMLEEDVRVALTIAIEQSGLGQNEGARKNDCSLTNVSDFLCHRKKPMPDIRKALGYELVFAYRKI